MFCYVLSALLLLGVVSGEETSAGRHILTQRPLGRYVHGWPGKFKPARLCPVGEQVVGFRAQVQKASSKDKVGITGLEMKCSGGDILGPDGIVDSGLGVWSNWSMCAAGSTVKGFNLRFHDVERYHHRRGDYYGASQIKMVCSDGVTLGPQGIDDGKWDEESGCSSSSHLCGYAAEVQSFNGNNDDTGVGRVKFLCCTQAKPLGALPALGDLTRLGADICIGVQQEKYGIIKMPVAGFLHSVTFVRTDGEVSCHTDPRRVSNFGCEFHHLRDAFSIFVTTDDNSVILPSKEVNQFNQRDHLFYQVIGKSARDANQFSLTAADPTFMTVGEEMRVWYGEDLWNRVDWDNGNYEVCVDVYGKILN